MGDAVVEGRQPDGAADHVQDGTDDQGDNECHEQGHREHEAARGATVESLAQEPSQSGVAGEPAEHGALLPGGVDRVREGPDRRKDEHNDGGRRGHQHDDHRDHHRRSGLGDCPGTERPSDPGCGRQRRTMA